MLRFHSIDNIVATSTIVVTLLVGEIANFLSMHNGINQIYHLISFIEYRRIDWLLRTLYVHESIVIIEALQYLFMRENERNIQELSTSFSCDSHVSVCYFVVIIIIF